MNDNIQSLFYQAIENEKRNHKQACEDFYIIIQNLQSKRRSLEEEKIFALCNMRMFIASKFDEGQYADQAIRSFRKYLSIQPEDTEIRFYLVDILEMSYRYDEAFEQLLLLCDQNETRGEALDRLSSEVYIIEGLIDEIQLNRMKRREHTT